MKQDFMRPVGADDVIDYRRDDFTHPPEHYDLILDLVAHRSVFAYGAHWHLTVRIGALVGLFGPLLRVLTAGWMVGRLAVGEGRALGKVVVDLA